MRMCCPACKVFAICNTVDSRPVDSGQNHRRRRECTACQQRFNTLETLVDVEHAPDIPETPLAVATEALMLLTRLQALIREQTAHDDKED